LSRRRSELDEAEAQRAPDLDADPVFVHTGSESDEARKLDSGDTDRLTMPSTEHS
jgi:hypothetical protein